MRGEDEIWPNSYKVEGSSRAEPNPATSPHPTQSASAAPASP